jgi:vitamin B12 transporter
MRLRNYVLGALALASAGPVLSDESELEIASVIVTATRTPESVDQTLASVTVVTRDDIDRLQPHSVAELLAGLPGVSIANTGGLGKATSVFLRGTEADEVLVLIDGIQVGSVTTGTTAFEQIPVDQIERIEIVRGPRSSLYGSDAIGGVIQIFTRTGDGTLTPSLSLSGGSYSTWQGQGGLSGGNEHAWYSISIAGLHTAGFPACRGVGAPIFAGCFVNPPPGDDGYWNDSGSVRGGYRFNNGIDLSADWLRVYGDTQYDGDVVNSSKVVQQVLGGTVKLPTLGFWHSSLTGGQSQDDSNDYLNGVYVDNFDTRRNSVSWQNEFVLAPQQRLIAGLDYLQDRVISTTPFPLTSRQDVGAFMQYQGGFNAAEVQLSLREDHDQQFGQRYTGGASAGYALTPALRVTASYGTAFEAPTFNDLYFPGYGNPALKPVSSRSWEIGVAGTPAGWNWALNVYQTDVDDLITYDAATGAPANVDRSVIRGLEGKLGATWRAWYSQLSLTLLDPRDRTPGDYDALLPRRAEQTARWDLDRQVDRYSVGATWFESGRRFDDLANTQSLGGYSTVDLRAGYQISHSWLLQIQLGNLFNKHYETAQYYNQPGRAAYLTLRYHPFKS